MKVLEIIIYVILGIATIFVLGLLTAIVEDWWTERQKRKDKEARDKREGINHD